MSGLIWAGLGKGISDAGVTFGNAMMRRVERDEAAALRAAEKEEDREFRRQQDALYRRPADGTSSGSGSGGSSGGGKISVATQAAEAGMTVPEYEAYWQAQETGDMSPFKQMRTIEDESGGHSAYGLPEGFDQYYKSKMRVLGEIRKKAELGKDYQNVAAGEQTAFETGLGQGIIGKNVDPTTAAQATTVMKGTAPFAGDSNVTRNVITGGTKTTDVGRSVITENQAQAGQANANAGKANADAGRIRERNDPETIRRLTDLTSRERTLRTQIGKLTGDLMIANQIKKGNPPAEYTEMMEELQEIKRERELLSGPKAAPPAPNPGDNKGSSRPGSLPAPKTKAELDKLPSGTRYTAPDGTERTKR
jgi:hypothetical protein